MLGNNRTLWNFLHKLSFFEIELDKCRLKLLSYWGFAAINISELTCSVKFVKFLLFHAQLLRRISKHPTKPWSCESIYRINIITFEQQLAEVTPQTNSKPIIESSQSTALPHITWKPPSKAMKSPIYLGLSEIFEIFLRLCQFLRLFKDRETPVNNKHHLEGSFLDKKQNSRTSALCKGLDGKQIHWEQSERRKAIRAH